MAKKLTAILLALAMLLALAACTDIATQDPTDESAAASDDGSDAVSAAASADDPVETDFDWYVSAGAGMGAALTMASETQAYCLTDKATFLANKAELELSILLEKGDDMKNTYSLIAVDPAGFDTDVGVNTEGAQALIDWMTGGDALSLISVYGQEQYGESLFFVDEEYAALVSETLPAVSTEAVTPPENPVIRLSTTTSVNDSGLLPYLLAYFEAESGYKVEVASAGTGAAIAAAEAGEADLLLVHAKASEEDFLATGKGVARIPFMYNFFVIVGPQADLADIADCPNAAEAFTKIAATDGASFISRGDNSGTHKAELKIWKAAAIDVPTAE